MRSLIYIKKMRNLKYGRWKVSGKRDCKRIMLETGDRKCDGSTKIEKGNKL